VGDEGSVAVSENDMPRPDIIVTSEPRGEGPIPVSSVALLAEVSSTSLAEDLGAKADFMPAMAFPSIGLPISAPR
jgi:hypothetical protein